MKAVYFAGFGGPEIIEFREVQEPRSPSGRELLVRVRAAGLNRADLLQRRGLYPPPSGYLPEIPGLEFAGEVVASGPGSSMFKPGDRVFGITSGEAQAEFLVVDERLVAPVPDRLTLVEAAAIPEAFITAHDAIITQAGLGSGEYLLIHAAGSGVGLAALQIAKAMNVFVIGTSRTREKIERGLDVGLDAGVVTADDGFADEVLRYTGGRGVDVVLDLVGAAYLAANLKCTAVKGRIMLVGLSGGAVAELDLRAVLSKRLTVRGTVLRSRSVDEKADAVGRFSESILPLLGSGTIRPLVDRVISASDAAEAHRYLESNQNFGKVVLEF